MIKSTSNVHRNPSPGESPGEPSRTPLTPRAASQRVLIVEDEKRLRDLLHASIAEMGLHPTAAGSGEAALKLIGQQCFAIAVVDLNLPGMNGLEFAEKLADLKLHIQVIILTGFGDLDAARRAIRLEVVDFLTKPCSMDDLEQALSRARVRWLDRWADGSHPSQNLSAFTEPISPLLSLTDLPDHSSIDDMERQLILAALSRHQGNRQAAAAELGISVRKIYYRLQQYQRAGMTPAE